MAAESDLALLTRAVRAAGEVALSFRGTPKSWQKADGSPVSEGDLAANQRLQEILAPARPDYGWISEESERTGHDLPVSFIVDPIDGTRAYMRGEDEWSIVAAVLHAGRPVAAAIFRPVTGTLFAAALGQGATRDGAAVRVTGRSGLAGARIAMPAALYKGAFIAAGIERAPPTPSLALRLAKIGEGRIDGVITKPGPHHWDLAAADLFVQEAGGTLTTLSGETLNYAAETTSHGSVFAGTPELAEPLRRLAAEQTAAL
ncbi:inositol monophosphatase [Stappia sp. 22II-S9-Z10]|nr:inositol monophosphatase [Stappia sp. 22II-S9-Z10]